MKYKIRVEIEVDPDAPWLEIGETDNSETIEELFTDFLYDIDDIKTIEVIVNAED